MMGKHSPLYFIYSIPPFSFFRVPSRFILLFAWSLVVLTGFGIQLFANFIRKKTSLKTADILIITIIIISLFDLFRFGYNYNPTGTTKEWLKKPETAEYLSNREGRYYTLGSPQIWNEVFLEKGWQESTKPYLYLNNGLQPNLNLLSNIPSSQVYPILVTNRYGLFSSLTNHGVDIKENEVILDDKSLQLLSMNNISHIICPFKLDTQGLVLAYETKEKITTLPSFKIYENKNVLPRAQVVYEYRKVETVEEMQRVLLSEDFDPGKEVVLERTPRQNNRQNLNSYSSSDPDVTSGERLNP